VRYTLLLTSFKELPRWLQSTYTIQLRIYILLYAHIPYFLDIINHSERMILPLEIGNEERCQVPRSGNEEQNSRGLVTKFPERWGNVIYATQERWGNNNVG
jgi:hypothetical protein